MKSNLDQNLWYIKNFLTEQEIDYILKECNEINNGSFSEGGWLFKSDAVERNTKNIAIKVLVKENVRNLFTNPDGIFKRIQNLFDGIGVYSENYTLQKLIPIHPKDWNGEQVALNFHYENSDPKNKNMVYGIIIYLNDNFKGGELIFQNKSFKIKPEPGMLIAIPVTEEYSHAVTHVFDNERITLYGHVWKDLKSIPKEEPKDYRINNGIN